MLIIGDMVHLTPAGAAISLLENRPNIVYPTNEYNSQRCAYRVFPFPYAIAVASRCLQSYGQSKYLPTQTQSGEVVWN